MSEQKDQMQETANNLQEQIELQQITNTPSGNAILVADRSESTISKSHTGHTTFTPSTALQNQSHYRIDAKKWCGFFRGYVRQDWHTVNVEDGVDELRAHWNELFFDLIYVACIVHLSAECAASISHDSSHRRLASSPNTPSSHSCEHEWKYSFILTGFAQFGILTNAWKAHVMYVTHFVFNQQIDNFFNLLYMLCILSMGIFIRDNESYERAFIISYGLLQLVTILLYLKVLLIPRGKWHAIWNICQCTVFLVIAIIISGSAHGLCAIDYFGIYIVLFFVEIGSLHLAYKTNCKPSFGIPVNVPHLSERYGLFIMLILGESIISIMSADIGELNLNDELKWTDEKFPSQILIAFILMTFVLSYCIARLYYDCQPPEEMIMQGDNNHALRDSKRSAILYLQAHQILFFGLLGLGMGIKISGKHLLETKRRWIDVVLPGYSLVVIVIALNMIRIAHPHKLDDNHEKISHRIVWIFRFILLIIMAVMPLFAKSLNQGVGFVIIFICVVLQLFVDFEGKEKIKLEKKELKEKRELAKQEHANQNTKPLYPAKLMRRITSGVGKL